MRRRKSSGVVYGLVADKKVWHLAVLVLQQLHDVKSKLPAVVFNTTALPEEALLSIAAFGASQVSLEPRMPVPDEFAKPLSASHGRLPAWTKLALWAQPFEKIIYLDLDVLILNNVDHMADFPRDSFTPEVCAWPQCIEDRIPAGINVGVMVIGPSLQIFSAFQDYALRRAGDLREAAAHDQLHGIQNGSRAASLGRQIVGSAEQSFIREFWDDVMNASISEPHPIRKGWDWDVRSFVSEGTCSRRKQQHLRQHPHKPPQSCTPGTVNAISRRYNARPADCVRCPIESLKPFIVHYACSPKPWERTRTKWLQGCKKDTNVMDYFCQPCVANWTMRWFDAEDRMCNTLVQVAPTALKRFPNAACQSRKP